MLPGSGDGIVMLSSGEPDGTRVVQEWMRWDIARRVMEERQGGQPGAQ